MESAEFSEQSTEIRSNTGFCSYCGEPTENTPEAVGAHIIDCPKRPELGLVLKVSAMEVSGDKLLKTIRALVEAWSNIEGMRTKVWELYHAAETEWEMIKATTPEEFAAIAREYITEEEEIK